MPIIALLKFVYLFLVCGRVISERLDFKSGFGDSAKFLEGITLELHCRQDSTEDMEISSPTEIIVQGSTLVHGMTHRYEYHKNSSASVLIINRLSREDQGIYACQEGQSRMFAQIHVLYGPSGKSPQCSSNYDSPVIFDDIRQDYINFSCATEEGNPPVLITLTVHESKSVHNITDLAKLCTVNPNFYNTSTLFCHVNESLGNTTFRCDVSQQFPSPYNGSYHGSCSFGPLHFLSNFSIKVNKSYETVKGDINLTCTTNETGVEITWIGIPDDWEYHMITSEYVSQVWIKHVKQQSASEITVQCNGSYGNRNVTDSATLMILGRAVLRKRVLSPQIFTIFIITFIIVGVLIVCFCWRKNHSKIYKHRADTNNSQSTYTTTVMTTNESVEEYIDGLHGSSEYDHSIVQFSSPDDDSDTKYYDIPLKSTKDVLDHGGYLIPFLSHPGPPLYQHVANR